ncbi:MAG: MerR family transcriptional regulator [Anaerolineales bacterium]
MSDYRETPTFNVKAVSHETGLKPDTLRAWERRYGLPSPDRSEGGHRLYSQRDIDILKWLVARQDEGLSISNAVDLWNRLKEEGEDPLLMPEYSLEGPGAAPSRVIQGDTIEVLQQQWVEACLNYDERTAEQVLNQAFGLYPVETVVLEIIRAGIAEIGDGWYQGNVVVQQEHFASELAIRRLEALLASTPPPSRSERLMLACPPDEMHTFSLLVLALVMRRRGWPVVYLGANVPLNRLQSAIDAANPKLVVAVAQQISTAASLRQMGEHLYDLDIPLAYGGDIFNVLPGLKDRITGHYLGELLTDAPKMIESLIAHPSRPTVAEPVSDEYKKTLNAYRDHLGLIDHVVSQHLNGKGTPQVTLDDVNEYMSRGLLAALQLGDITLLNREIGWVEELIVHHMPEGRPLPDYLDAYYQAIKIHLDEQGKVIIDWLEDIR